MHLAYTDILSRISEKPRWFDECAVPRYCEFSPRATANIYADEVALVEIECQGCRQEFNVAFTDLNLRDELWDASGQRVRRISDLITDRRIHYGDPPNIGCCDAGPTMSSIPRRVLEYWFKPIIRGTGTEIGERGGTFIRDIDATRFQRDSELEITIRPRQ